MSRDDSRREADAVGRMLEGVWRIESAQIIATLMRILGDLDLAEEIAQDTLVIALEQWPIMGVPDKPGAWLTATAKHRAIDRIRRNTTLARKQEDLAREAAINGAGYPDQFDALLEEDLGDELLCLIFMACHPILGKEARVALTLRYPGGLTTEEIARAFLIPKTTIAQRIVRAKRTLTEEEVVFEVPQTTERTARLASVLEVIYLIFNEGYAATSGDDWVRPALCEDALRLGRMLSALMPEEAEVHGLAALMELQASRLRARVGPTGEPILLLDQNRARWDWLLIERGLAALARAEQLGGAQGFYALQAAIAACHGRARTAEQTDWMRIAALYAVLAHVAPSPVVELNRAMAVAMAYGPEAGLEIVDRLCSEPSLQQYHWLPSARGDLLYKLGRFREAEVEFSSAASLTNNLREQTLLLAHAQDAARSGDSLRPPPR